MHVHQRFTYWSDLKGTGQFLEVLVALNHCRPVWAEPYHVRKSGLCTHKLYITVRISFEILRVKFRDYLWPPKTAS